MKMGHNQRCIQQAMAFDAISALYKKRCVPSPALPHPLQARRSGVNKRSKRGLNEAATRSL